MIAISSDTCVYCLQTLTKESCTIDHVIARSWYPPDRPRLREWKVYACSSCNNKFSRIEGRLRQRLSLAVDTNKPILRKIYEASRRAWTTGAAHSLHDAFHRHKAKQAILNDLVTLVSPQARGVIPSSRLNFWKGSRTGIRLDSADVTAISEKWTRGIHACEIGELITSDYEIGVHFLDDRALPAEISDLMRHAKLISKDAEVQVWQAYVREEDTFGALYRFHMWQSFTVYTSVGKRTVSESVAMSDQ
jgi:hypothetical protein